MFARLSYVLLLGAFGLAATAADSRPDFEQDIAPLLVRRCVECHEGSRAAGGLQLNSAQGLLAGGESGAAIDRESPRVSYLLARVNDGEMPPEQRGHPQKLPQAEIDLLRRWIVTGARWPQGRTLDYFERTNDVRAGRDWWSLQPIQRPSVPKLRDQRSSSPIDAFVRSRLVETEMNPAPQASPSVRLRRLYHDLIGLPPTQRALDNFMADPSDQAWEAAIDQLLESPQYGVRWGRYWLDLARYADTSGYERDQEKPFAWKYRDWVVAAFNDDMPYDQFIIHQLAGDEILDRDKQSTIATGFLRLGTWNDEPNDPADYVYDRIEDLVHTTSATFLGMTVKCARCHRHKFDPITQEDYYRMASAFWAGPVKPGDRQQLGGPTADLLGFDDVLGWTDVSRTPAPIHLLQNGERDKPLDEVQPASLSFVPKLERPFQPAESNASTTHRRRQLAEWIAHPENPLTPRVLVNRLWLHHFGQAIVRSPNNFGFLADSPTHSKLLDWLADEFVQGGWRIKRMHKLILLSETWQQSSVHPRQAEYHQRDAANRLWWRAQRRRLDAETLRDAMLFSSGELDLRLGGEGFRPFISPDALEGLSRKAAAWTPSPSKDQLRRSLYVYSKRGLLPPMMTTFDMCDTTQSCGERVSTTVPTQALTLLNNRFVHQRSAHLAKTAAEAATPRSQVKQLWSSILQRAPTDDELGLALSHVEQQRRLIEEERLRGKDVPSEVVLEPGIAALASLAHVLLNSNEFLYID